MDCYEFQDKISPYIEKELSLSDVNRFDNHTASCKMCASTYAGVCSAMAVVKKSDKVTVSDNFNDRLLARLRKEKGKSIRRIGVIGSGKNFFGYEPRYAFASLMAIILIVILTVGIFPEKRGPSPVRLSTQGGLMEPVPQPINGNISPEAMLSSEDSEEDSLKSIKPSQKVTPHDFGGKIQLVKDKKK